MSYYGYGYGTASGERYDRNALACAGADRLPMLSRWVLRSPETGRVAIVKINDRGRFQHMNGGRRLFDCTPGVWHALGYSEADMRRKGVVHIEARPA